MITSLSVWLDFVENMGAIFQEVRASTSTE
jgi:hypothetical protein